MAEVRRTRSALGAMLALAFFFAPAAAVRGAEPTPTGNSNSTAGFYYENDLFGRGKSDRYYTSGVRLFGYTQFDEDRIPLIDADVAYLGGVVGQQVYTPEDLDRADLIQDDRPYAGWLYLGLLVVAYDPADTATGPDVEHTAGIELGVIGKQAFAEEAQSEIHRITGGDRPAGWNNQLDFEVELVVPAGGAGAAGWNNQLDFEVGVHAFYRRKWRWRFPLPLLSQLSTRWTYELSPSLGLSVGNVFTHISIGGGIRLGYNVPPDYLSSGQSVCPCPKQARDAAGWGFYGFAGLQTRFVARNIFLDGNTFKSSHKVDKEHVVADLEVGAAVVIPLLNGITVTYRHIVRSREFKRQPDLFQNFGAFDFAISF